MFHYYTICFLGLTGSLSAKYCLDAGKGNTSVKYIKVVSERCSGSYYTSALLVENIENLSVMDSDKYGIKHFHPWFGYESSYYGPEEDYTFKNSEDVLFVILFRNPYDWLSSFKESAFFGPANLQVCDFSEFIRGEWGMNMNYEIVRQWKLYHPLIDSNPANGLPFKNVIKLRTAKIKNFLEIPKRVENYYIINYEKVRDYPKEVVKEVAKFFNIGMKAEFTPITKKRGIYNAEIYKPKEYPQISLENFLYINEQLDKELENSIGYELLTPFSL